MMFKKCIFVFNLLLLGIFLFACEKKAMFNSNPKETSTLNNDVLVKENGDKQKINSSRKEEIANIVFEVPQYYSQEETGVEYYGFALDAFFYEKVMSNSIGFSSIDSTNTESVKSNKEDLIKTFGKIMDVVIKTEDSMVDNNYVLRIMGSKGESTLAVVVLVNDSANKGVFVFFANKESEKYSDFSKMIDNAIFKVDDLELVGGIYGTTKKSDGYGFSTYISGVVKNNTSKKYSYVQITFALFDKDGNKVGTALANVNSLDAGETWKFEAIALKDFSTYKLDEITGW